MNGAFIPAVFYYVITFTPAVPAQPLYLMGPVTRDICYQMEREIRGAECRVFHTGKGRWR